MEREGKKKKKKKVEQSTRYLVYTDGGCIKNPGGPGGYGIVIVDSHTGTVEKFSEGFAKTTNNRMELMALIKALEILREKKIMTGFTVFSDSEYAINEARGTWERNKNLDLLERYDTVSEGMSFFFSWVRGHSGDHYNELCDTMATEAMQRNVLSKDEGYRSAKSFSRPLPEDICVRAAYADDGTGSPKKGAMGVRIDVPEGLDLAPLPMDVKEYAKRYHVSESCAGAILGLYAAEERNFRSYADLKVGGLDEWSGMGEALLSRKIGASAADAVRTNLSGNAGLWAPCMRWICRGLTVSDAIRKVLVDREISENRQNSGGRRRT